MRDLLKRLWQSVKPDGPHEVVLLLALGLLWAGLSGIDWHVAAVVDGMLLGLVALGFSLERKAKP